MNFGRNEKKTFKRYLVYSKYKAYMSWILCMLCNIPVVDMISFWPTTNTRVYEKRARVFYRILKKIFNANQHTCWPHHHHNDKLTPHITRCHTHKHGSRFRCCSDWLMTVIFINIPPKTIKTEICLIDLIIDDIYCVVFAWSLVVSLIYRFFWLNFY